MAHQAAKKFEAEKNAYTATLHRSFEQHARGVVAVDYNRRKPPVPKAVAIEAKEWPPLNGPHLPSVGTSRYDQSGNQNMLELTELQHLELQRSDESPPGILDPVTNTRYVLVRSDEFDRVRSIVESDGLDMRQVGQLVNAAMREDDAGDPTLEFYQKEYGRQR